MKYSNGQDIQLGDKVLIDTNYHGLIVAVIEDGLFSAAYPEKKWGYLKKGILVDTDFGGLIHYTDLANEYMVLAERSH